MSAYSFPESAERSTANMSWTDAQRLAHEAVEGRTYIRTGTTPSPTGNEFTGFDWPYQENDLQRAADNLTLQDGEDAERLSDTESVHVDTYNDGVYYVNNGVRGLPGPGSYTRTFEDIPNHRVEDDPMFAQILQRIRLGQARAGPTYDGRCCQPPRTPSPEGDHDEDEEYHNEKHNRTLRGVMREIKELLRQGLPITLEYSAGQSSLCALPAWRGRRHAVPAGAYFVIIGSVEVGRSQSTLLLCLHCLEYVWSGQGMMGTIPSPDVLQNDTLNGALDSQDDRQSISGLDGACDEEGELGSTIDGSTYSGADHVPAYPLRDDVQRAATFCRESRNANISSCSDANTPRDVNALEADTQEPLLASKGKAITHGATTLSSPAHKLQSGHEIELARNTSNLAVQRTRRCSARLQTATPAPLVSCRTKDETRRLAAINRVTRASDKHIIDTAKGETRLLNMTTQRDELLEKIEPGDRQPINVRGSKNKKTVSGFKPHTSMDMFGITYTDLLEEPATPGFQRAIQDSQHASTAAISPAVVPKGPSSPLIGSILGKTATPNDYLPRAKTSCKCYAPDSGKMVQCSNGDKCLRGWYHLRCVKDENPEQEGWLCAICKPEIKEMDTMRQIVDEICKPVYAGKSIYGFDQPMQKSRAMLAADAGWYGLGVPANQDAGGDEDQSPPAQEKNNSPQALNGPLKRPVYLSRDSAQIKRALTSERAPKPKQTGVFRDAFEELMVGRKAKANQHARQNIRASTPKGLSIYTQDAGRRLSAQSLGVDSGTSEKVNTRDELNVDVSPTEDGLVAATDLASDNGLLVMNIDDTTDAPPPSPQHPSSRLHLRGGSPRSLRPIQQVRPGASPGPSHSNTSASNLSARATPFFPSAPSFVQPSSSQASFSSLHANAPSFTPAYAFGPIHRDLPTNLAASTPRYHPNSTTYLAVPNTPAPHPNRLPPTRFQTLAPFIRAGGSLTEWEKAALMLWKLSLEEKGAFEAFGMSEEELVRLAGLERCEWKGRDLEEVLEMVLRRV